MAWAIGVTLSGAPALTLARREAGRVPQREDREDRDDQDAVQAFQRGEKEVFDRLVLKYQRMVYRLCFRYTGNHPDADDLAQEVFVRAYRGLDGFRSESRFSTWLYRIALNAGMNWVSGRKVSETLPENLTDTAPSALERLSREQATFELRRAIERLPEKQRATLLLRVDQELSHKEIAEIMGSPVGTVKANLFFALANLRKLMGVQSKPVRGEKRS